MNSELLPDSVIEEIAVRLSSPGPFLSVSKRTYLLADQTFIHRWIRVRTMQSCPKMALCTLVSENQRPDRVKLLLGSSKMQQERGKNDWWRDDGREEVMHLACSLENGLIVKELLSAVPDDAARAEALTNDGSGDTTSCASFGVYPPNLFATRRKASTPLSLACEKNRSDVVRQIFFGLSSTLPLDPIYGRPEKHLPLGVIKYTYLNQTFPLRISCHHLNAEVVHVLVVAGADVTKAPLDNNESTAIEIVMRNNKTFIQSPQVLFERTKATLDAMLFCSSPSSSHLDREKLSRMLNIAMSFALSSRNHIGVLCVLNLRDEKAPDVRLDGLYMSMWHFREGATLHTASTYFRDIPGMSETVALLAHEREDDHAFPQIRSIDICDIVLHPKTGLVIEFLSRVRHTKERVDGYGRDIHEARRADL